VAETDTNIIRVSRLINAPASAIFSLLADPSRQTDIDGTKMLRGSDSAPVTAVGDVFEMKMWYEAHGDYLMANRIYVFEQDRRIGWEPTRIDKPDAEPWNPRWSFELEPHGDTSTLVTEVYDCTGTPKEGQQMMDHGKIWITGMEKTLAKIDETLSST
jgi:hypothetical protein